MKQLVLVLVLAAIVAAGFGSFPFDPGVTFEGPVCILGHYGHPSGCRPR